MLMGEYQHTIDVKGRLFMPAKLRETQSSVKLSAAVLSSAKGWMAACLYMIKMNGISWNLNLMLCR